MVLKGFQAVQFREREKLVLSGIEADVSDQLCLLGVCVLVCM
jgi:hypothetical protein